MARCLLCGRETKGGYFCKASGHHRIYKAQLLRELRAGTISQEHLEHLNFFHWMPEMQVVSGSETMDLPFPADFDGDVVPVVKTKRTRKPKVVGNPVAFRKFGVELECVCPLGKEPTILSEVNSMGYSMIHTDYTHEDMPQWKSLYDGSVRGDYGYESKEFVSPPFETEAGLEEVSNICKIIIDNGGLTNKTTGTHIHLDASDLTPQEIAKVVYLYGMLETRINHLVPEDRKNGQYCKSVRRFCKYVAKSGFDYFDNVRKITRVLGTRYLKVNVEAYLRHGTLEFRQLNGTLDGDLVKYWVKLCTRIVDYVKSGKDVTTISGNIYKVLGSESDEIAFWNKVKADLVA